MSTQLTSQHKRAIDSIVNRELTAVREGPPKDWEAKDRRTGDKRTEAKRLEWWRDDARTRFRNHLDQFIEDEQLSDEDVLLVRHYASDLWSQGGLAVLDPVWAKAIATEQQEDMVKGIFKLNGYGVIAAPSKSGKSWLALELATAVHTGTPFINAEEFDVPKRRSVTVFYPEGVGAVFNRLNMLWRARGFDGFDPYCEKLTEGYDDDGFNRPPSLSVLTNRLNFSSRRDLDNIANFLSIETPELVIFDSAYLSLGGVDGASQNQLGDVLATLHDTVTNACGASMWVTTHYRKGLNKADLNSISGAGWDNWPNDWLLLERLTSANDHKLRMRMLAYGRDWKGAALDVVTEMEDGNWSTTVGVKVAQDSESEDALGRIVRHMVDHIEANGPSKVGAIKGAVKGKTTLKSEAWNFLKHSGKVKEVESNLWDLSLAAGGA
jgi:hypothetical protein